MQPVRIHVGDEEITLTEDNSWVCLFTDAPWIDHVYIHGDRTSAMFECRALMDHLVRLGFPMQVRRLPLPWDTECYDKYIQAQIGDVA